MTPATTRAYHHGDLRQALLVAAEAELIERGVEGFTLRGCAKRAGVSHAAPAHHFRDADALLSALAAEGFARLSLSLRARQEKVAGADARERMLAAGLGYIDFALANAALFRLMFSSSRPDHEAEFLMKAGSDAFGALVGAVRDLTGREFGVDPAATADVTAAWAMVHGVSELMLAGKLSFIDALPPEAREAFLVGVVSRVMP